MQPVPLVSDALRPGPALAVRDACIGWLPFGGVLARLGDPIVRRWMRRTGSPYADEIEANARALNCSGIWLLHGAYLFGCTALADETATGPRLRRTLDWPFPGLGRLVEVVRRESRAGPYLNVTWPGFVGVLTAVAPGRFAASINQAPMRQRTLLWLDYALNALAGLRSTALPPEHLLRQVFETCMTFEQARRLLETTPVARPALFTLVGCKPGERVVIERDDQSTRTYRQDLVVANDWQERRSGWRPRCPGEGDAGREQPQPPRSARPVGGARRGCRLGERPGPERLHAHLGRDVAGDRRTCRCRLGGLGACDRGDALRLVERTVVDAIGRRGGEHGARFVDRALIGVRVGETGFCDEPLEAGRRIEDQHFRRLERLEAVFQPRLGVQEVALGEGHGLAIDGEA
jgi:hypothetical protein